MKIGITFIVLLTSISCFAQEKTPEKIWSLQECMEYAIENNLQIKQKR